MRINKYFKLFESRTSDLSQDEFYKLLKENCSDFINNPKQIQRIKDDATLYSYINPKIHSRKDGQASIATNLMLLLDNLPSWKNYPKRENSIIGISKFDISNSYSYGNYYFQVIPFNGAKFGSAPGDDVWAANIRFNDKNISLSNFHSSLKAVLPDTTNYIDMIDKLQTIYDNFLLDDESFKTTYNFLSTTTKSTTNLVLVQFKEILTSFKDNNIKNIEEGLSNLLEPSELISGRISDGKKGFELYNYSELEMRYSEVWTDSECLLYLLGEAFSCDECGDTGKKECYYCNGNGEKDCHCIDGNSQCNDCDGVGENDEGESCVSCGGNGYSECEDCDSKGYIHCDDCDGEGYIDCEYCGGSAGNNLSNDTVNNVFDDFVRQIKRL